MNFFSSQVVVTLVVLSLDGSTMGTAEVKLAEEGIGGLVSLKFWESASQNKEYILSTIVYEPHRFVSPFFYFWRNLLFTM